MDRMNDRAARTRAAFERAAALMAQYRILPLPAHYEIWFAYASEEIPHLTSAIDAWIASGDPFTESLVTDLRARFFDTPQTADTMHKVGDRLTNELDKITASLVTAGQDTSTYNRTLSSAAGILGKDSDLKAIRVVVDNLSVATSVMERRNLDLERRLQESTREVGALREDMESIRRQALTDTLTGIANRKCFDERLREAIQDARTNNTSMCLLMGDIDFFKRFNDTWGHQTGDQVLRLVARALTENVKGRDTPARYGGEEFAVILPNTTIEAGARLADQIRAAVEAKKVVKRSTGETLGTITMSLGVASLESDDIAATLIDRADAALYEAKKAGRNCVRQLAASATRKSSAA